MRRDPQSTFCSDAYPAALIERCKKGERAALAEVFGLEIPFMERVLSKFCQTRPDVEDLVQSTLEQAILAFPQFRGEASVRTWLTRIAVRNALRQLKHPSRKRRAPLALIEGGRADESPSRPHAEAEARMRLGVLQEHLLHLDPKHHLAFILFQVEGHSMEEVSALMDSQLSTTKSRVMWARRKLLSRLQKDPRARPWLAEYGGNAHDDA